MNRRGFMRFFGTAPVAAASVVLAPVTHAEVRAISDAAGFAMAGVSSLQDRVLVAEFGASDAQSLAAMNEAIIGDLHTRIAPMAKDVDRVIEPMRAARLVSEPPMPVMLVYVPPRDEA